MPGSVWPAPALTLFSSLTVPCPDLPGLCDYHEKLSAPRGILEGTLTTFSLLQHTAKNGHRQFRKAFFPKESCLGPRSAHLTLMFSRRWIRVGGSEGLAEWALLIGRGSEPAKRKFTPSLREFYIQLEEIIINKYNTVKRKCMQDFLGGPMAKTLRSQCRKPEFNPWSGS